MSESRFKKVRTRIAPSPTGNLHLGTVRTALYNLLFARYHGGDFLFRLEDTDKERSKEEFTNEILDGFKWLNISWDDPSSEDAPEGAEMTGLSEGHIVKQSVREAIHKKYITKLLSEGKAYKCFASKEELDEMRAKQQANKEIPRYDNRSRNLSEADQAKFESEGKPFVVRLNLGADRDIPWNDLIRGEMSINTKDLGGDPVIQKSSGQVLYNFAVVVDDFAMQISHIFRGEDHLSNTAKQIAIYEALGFSVPEFGHLPLIFTKDKQKLSKRKHGDIASVDTYKKQGYLPEALVNYLVGTSYNDEELGELFSIEEAADEFDIEAVSKSPAIYDIKKLNWYNREYISKLDYADILNNCAEFSKFSLKTTDKYSQDQIEAMLKGIQDSLDKFDEVDIHIDYFFEDFSVVEDKILKTLEDGKIIVEKLLILIDADGINFADPVSFKNALNSVGKILELNGKKLFMPARIAISGKTSGPDIGLIAHLLGEEKIKERLKKIQDKLTSTV